jgi:hypothetical protein
MKTEVQEEVIERKVQPRLRSLKKRTYLETAFWVLLATPLYIWSHNWVAVALVAVILIKIATNYQMEKLFLLTSYLLDELQDMCFKHIETMKSKKKGKANGSTNARANRKK